MSGVEYPMTKGKAYCRVPCLYFSAALH